MTTKNENVLKIASLLHRSRSASWTSDNTLELSQALRNQPPAILALALLEFSQAMLRAAHGVVSLQLAAAIIDEITDERDAAGGQLQ